MTPYSSRCLISHPPDEAICLTCYSRGPAPPLGRPNSKNIGNLSNNFSVSLTKMFFASALPVLFSVPSMRTDTHHDNLASHRYSSCPSGGVPHVGPRSASSHPPFSWGEENDRPPRRGLGLHGESTQKHIKNRLSNPCAGHVLEHEIYGDEMHLCVP